MLIIPITKTPLIFNKKNKDIVQRFIEDDEHSLKVDRLIEKLKILQQDNVFKVVDEDTQIHIMSLLLDVYSTIDLYRCPILRELKPTFEELNSEMVSLKCPWVNYCDFLISLVGLIVFCVDFLPCAVAPDSFGFKECKDGFVDYKPSIFWTYGSESISMSVRGAESYSQMAFRFFIMSHNRSFNGEINSRGLVALLEHLNLGELFDHVDRDEE